MAANANKTTAKKPVANKEIVQEQEVITAPKKQLNQQNQAGR